jgi:hypothetical protein
VIPLDVSIPLGLPAASWKACGASSGSCGSNPAAHHASGRVLALAVAVDRVPARHRAQASDLDAVRELGQEIALDGAAGRRTLEGLVEKAVSALREAGLDFVQRATEVREAGPDEERVVGAVSRFDARLGHHLGDDRVVVGDRNPARADRKALRRYVVAEGKRAHAGEQSAARRSGGHRLGYRERERQRVLRQGVEIGRLRRRVGVVGVEVVRARGVAEDQQRIRSVVGVVGGWFEVIVATGA